MLNPIEHARDEQGYERYKVEPYVIAGDVYYLKDHIGRGGWTWYTGAAGWIYRVWLEEVLGFKRRGDQLLIDPVIPKDWPGFQLRYRYQNASYEVAIENPEHLCGGVALMELDGAVVPNEYITLQGDGQTHKIRILMGSKDDQ